MLFGYLRLHGKRNGSVKKLKLLIGKPVFGSLGEINLVMVDTTRNIQVAIIAATIECKGELQPQPAVQFIP